MPLIDGLKELSCNQEALLMIIGNKCLFPLEFIGDGGTQPQQELISQPNRDRHEIELGGACGPSNMILRTSKKNMPRVTLDPTTRAERIIDKTIEV
jgi:hypothetical protein